MSIGCVLYVIYTAWASALLILGWKACEGLVRGMSSEIQDPALFLYGFL